MNLSHLFLLIAILGAQAPQTPVSIEEYLKLRQVRTVQVSPDGGEVAFTAAGADLAANHYRSELFIWRPGSGARPAAAGFDDARAPRWSHDGAWLSFSSAGPGLDAEPQLWILPVLADDHPFQLSELPGGVYDYGWAPDGTIYALTVNQEGGGREIWRILVPGGTAELVWGGDAGIREIAVSPDGGSIVYSTNGTGAAMDFLNYDLHVLDIESRSTRRLTSRPGSEVAPVWSPDGSTIVFRAPQTPRYMGSQAELFSVSAGGSAPLNLTDSFDRAVIDHRWPAGGDLMFTAALGTHTHLVVAREDGSIQALTRGEFNYGPFGTSAAGTTIYAVRESGSEPSELWRISDSRFERLTELNGHAENWKLGRQQVIQWQAPDGLAIEAVLVYPADYQEGRRYPLLVSPTGGPASRSLDTFSQNGGYQLFAARGYAVLAPNVRGSAGYGEDFATANRDDLAGGDIIDMMAGVDAVIEMGVADADRVAIYGSGYGAEVTSWAITRTPRFAAAVAVFESSSAVSAPAPERSATANARYIRTPLLIVDAADDFATLVPYSQPRELYQALSDLTSAVEYLERPADEAMNPRPRGRSDLFFRQLRWFDRYLKFGGAELFDFYLVGEPVPGSSGWELRVESAAARADYSGMRPESGRYLEVALSLRPADRSARGFTLDPATGLSLVGPDDRAGSLTGTVTEVFGQETLILGMPSPVSVPRPRRGSTTALAFRLAFEIPDEAAVYRLLVEGFAPVRIWVAGND